MRGHMLLWKLPPPAALYTNAILPRYTWMDNKWAVLGVPSRQRVQIERVRELHRQ